MVDTLTKEQIAVLNAAFLVFDTNGDGKITRDELGNVLKALGMTPTDEELQTVIDEVDSDGNGTIEFPEFMQMMTSKMKYAVNEEEIQEAFKLFDRNGDGFITALDLYHVMNAIGERMTPEELEAMIKEADTDGDGKVSFEEFVALMKSTDTF